MFAAGWLLGRASAKLSATADEEQEKIIRENKRNEMKTIIYSYLREHPNSTCGNIAKALDIEIPKLNGYLVFFRRQGLITKTANGTYIIKRKED